MPTTSPKSSVQRQACGSPLPTSDLRLLASGFWPLASDFRPRASVFPTLASGLRPLSSVFCPPSSDPRSPASALWPLSSVFCLLSSVLCLLSPALKAAPVSSDSPFLPAPSQSAAVKVAGPLQLSGIMIVSGTTYVCITETTTKKSRWIAVGTKVDDLEVVSCAPAKNEAVLRTHGETLTLTLRKVTPSKGLQTFAAPQPSASPSGPPAEKADDIAAKLTPLVTREEKEREARMLVSDLLDLSMRQRKAYEEARKKADEEAAAKKK